jgi:hypothetical protein
MIEQRKNLPPLPPAMRLLPLDPRGYPIPWFVAYIDGKPDFRVMDPDKLEKAYQHGFCWICGGPLMARKCFVLGPMCTIQAVSEEPPSHLDCALYAVRACPFIVLPNAKRRLSAGSNAPSGTKIVATVIDANPGMYAIWIARRYTVQRPPRPLFGLTDCTGIYWYKAGREATAIEALTALHTAYATLRAAGANAAIARGFARVLRASGLEAAAAGAGPQTVPEYLRALQEKTASVEDAGVRAELVEILEAGANYPSEYEGVIENRGSDASAAARAWLNREFWGYDKH